MKKNGFAFIETVITVVVLSASLLFIYGAYSAILSEEEKRVYYDDMAHIYMNNYIRKFLEEYSDIENIKRNNKDDVFILTIGSETDNLFNQDGVAKKANLSLNNIYDTFHVNQALLVKTTTFDTCMDATNTTCNNTLNRVSINLRNYLNTINDTSYDYYLVIEYSEKVVDDKTEKCTPEFDTHCTTYYASIGM